MDSLAKGVRGIVSVIGGLIVAEVVVIGANALIKDATVVGDKLSTIAKPKAPEPLPPKKGIFGRNK